MNDVLEAARRFADEHEDKGLTIRDAMKLAFASGAAWSADQLVVRLRDSKSEGDKGTSQ